MGAQVKSAPHILDLEMLRDQLVADRDKLHDELIVQEIDAVLDPPRPLDDEDPQLARTFGAWCAVQDVLGRVEVMVKGWRNDVPQSLKAETLINNGNDWIECRECSDLVALGDAFEVLLDDNGPGEPPSSDGHVCQACNDFAERAAREAEDLALETAPADFAPEGDQYCHRCEENLIEPVWLELNSATGEWVKAGSADWSDGPDSQGAFPFGTACARRVLKTQTQYD